MHYSELFDRNELYEMIQAGYVTVRNHLELPLQILNYSDTCQYAQMWNTVTTNCRGLIIDTDGNVVARGFPKFFNYGQPGAAEIALNRPVEVLDKADGSLGIMYPTPDGYAIATRGSFHSDQAIYATNLLRTKYSHFTPRHDMMTVLFEIVYPENRIVLDYGDTSDLILLGMVVNDTGRAYGPTNLTLQNWDGPRATSFGTMKFESALALPPRPNAEGLVIRDRVNGTMLKIKQEDYIRLHKLVFGLSEKAVWEHLSTHDGDISGMLEGLPDEFHGWVKEKAESLKFQFWQLQSSAEAMFANLRLDKGQSRKDFAATASQYPVLRPYLFMLLDGKDISPAIWKAIKPKGSTPMVRQSEDVA